MSNHNAMHPNNVVEDQEALIYQTYPCGYFVQSPSTLSHANSADIRSNIQNDADSTFHSPIRSETHPPNPTHYEDPTHFTLCRYNYSQGSNHSFLHHKKISYDSSHGTATTENGLVIINGDSDGDEEDEEDKEEKNYLMNIMRGREKKER